ncbi:Arc family DNA-binding protein [Mesorhizobium ciceri]|uniref:Arc family DNA-binding protein n=1 Tax=Mesorhizobium ciceri TaxID=39645 RepID=UPI0004B6D70D|nr:Arc family DNA-binding protein [Mesorhizobium ciceri]
MSDRTALQLRLPQDVKAFIEAQATRNASSQNSEIVRCIRERMDQTKTATSELAGSN